jgi:putative transposase
VLELVRYLHLNLQRMRLPMQAATYRWSSHGAYLGKDSLVRVEPAPVLGEFAKSLGTARLGYLRLMAEGQSAGHQPDYYDVRNQRFLGDEKFVEEIDERVQKDREIATPTARVKLAALLPLVARAHGTTEKDLIQAGRRRKWIRTRSMLVYLGRESGRVSVKELGKRLHRDPSVISRLYPGVCRSSG